MTYLEYVKQARDMFIVKDEESGKFYLRPDWRHAIDVDGFYPDTHIDGYHLSVDELHEYLELEVGRLNLKADKTSYISNWIYTVLTSTVEPALTDAENQFAAQIIDYMKEKNQIEQKEKELTKQEETLQQKTNIFNSAPGFDFSKKKT